MKLYNYKTWALHYCALLLQSIDELIWWKLNSIQNLTMLNMKLHATWFQFNLNWIELKWTKFKLLDLIQIQLKRNGMQIGEKCIENLLVTMV
jgi:hypothetical protein